MTTAPTFSRPTAVGYCRVSTAEQAQHGWSIEQQEDSIRAYADAQGLDLLAVFRDAGRSGRSMQRREGLLGLLETVHHGGVGVVIVKAQDRLARAVDHALGLRQYLHQHHTDLLFLDGALHLSAKGPAGGAQMGAELIASLTAVLAEEEIATLKRRILPNLAKAARQGRRGGRLPLGYLRDPEGRVSVETHDAGLISQAVQAILSGVGVSSLQRTWIANGIRDHLGAIISFDRLRGALTNPFLVGDMRYRLPPEAVADDADEIRIPGHHAALIDPVTFQRVQDAIQVRAAAAATPRISRSERRRRQRQANRLPASGDLLAALRPPARAVHGAIPPEALRCGVCQGPMYASLMTVGGAGRRHRRAVYLCRYHKDRGAAFCAQKPVPAAELDETVFTLIAARLRDGRLEQDTPSTGITLGHLAGAAELHRSSPAALVQASQATEALRIADAQRQRLRVSLDRLGESAPAVLRERLAQAEAEHDRLLVLAQRPQMERPVPIGPSWDLRHKPRETWEALDAAGRRRALAPILSQVVVRQRSLVALALRRDDGSADVVSMPADGLSTEEST